MSADLGVKDGLSAEPYEPNAQRDSGPSRVDPLETVAALARDSSEESLELLLALMSSAHGDLGGVAAEVLPEHPLARSAAATLGRMLSDPLPCVARRACSCVARLGLVEFHDDIVTLLRDESALTRAGALEALGMLWQPADFDRLVEVMRRDRSHDARMVAARTLRAHADRGNWEGLAAGWFAGIDHELRVLACALAAEFGPAPFEAQIRSLLSEPTAEVAACARRALGMPIDTGARSQS